MIVKYDIHDVIYDLCHVIFELMVFPYAQPRYALFPSHICVVDNALKAVNRICYIS